MQTLQSIQTGQSEASKNLVESIPVKEDVKLLPVTDVLSYSWQEFAGLSWILLDKEGILNGN